ncbi:uncharacterized protein METZ01_LOCUS252403 [marine metagenome]|uniref:Uncharacterized protein n=1 Tax=marine metagenome TaxID=408172 RepID=A0A382IJU0_9ZZZZ
MIKKGEVIGSEPKFFPVVVSENAVVGVGRL